MSTPIIQVDNLSKQYRLGQVGSGWLQHDINRWWHRIRGKEDPYLTIGATNDRTQKSDNEYVWALNNINFEVQPGEVLGIIGRNGAGKSTLLKILSRVTEPTTGRIAMRGRVASLLEVGTGFHPDLTGRENIFLNGAILGMTKKEITRKFDEIVDFAGVERYIDTPVKRYSSGMHVRLGFAVAAHLEPEILIVDEVLAVGDAEFQKKCLGKMKAVSTNEGRTVLFVSHNMGAVQNLCNRALVLQEGNIVKDGDVQEALAIYLDYENASNKINFSNGPITQVEVKQVGEAVFLIANYNVDEGIDIPNLGFVFYNSQGIPIYGSNPILDKCMPSLQRTYKSGTISATINEPKLIDGNYTVSIYFGDSKEDYVALENCMQFTVVGMVKRRHTDANRSGNIEPQVKWQIH